MVEAIRQYGFDGYYIPMDNSVARNLLFGDDPLKKFTQAYPLEFYMSNSEGYIGEQEFFSKFGLEIHNTVSLMMSKRSFEEWLPQDVYARPKEGDLVYIPFSGASGKGELMEIKFVQGNKDFFVLGRKSPYFYELQLEKFKYSQEIVQTGVADIDIVSEDAYTLELNMDMRLKQTFTSSVWSSAVANGNTLTINTQNSTLINDLTTLSTGDSFSFVYGSNTVYSTFTSLSQLGFNYTLALSNTVSGSQTVTSFSAPVPGGFGAYVVGETVTQIASSAIVKSWTPTTGLLEVINISGEFGSTTPIVGSTSGASYYVKNYDEISNIQYREVYDNKIIQNEANSVINFGEVNPFGSI